MASTVLHEIRRNEIPSTTPVRHTEFRVAKHLRTTADASTKYLRRTLDAQEVVHPNRPGGVRFENGSFAIEPGS